MSNAVIPIDHSHEPMFLIGRYSFGRAQPDPEREYVHAEIEIGMTLSGKGSVQVNRKKHHLGPGDVWFYDSNIPHRHDRLGSAPLETLFVHIKYEAFAAMLPPDRQIVVSRIISLLHAGLVEPVVRGDRAIAALLAGAEKAYRGGGDYGYMTAWAKVIECFARIGASVERASPAGGPPPWATGLKTRLADAFLHLQLNYTRDITSAELARIACLSNSRFIHLFTDYFGMPPVAYRNNLRINRALHLLTQTDEKVESIALRCGFNSLAQFRLLFKRKTRRTPGSLRR